MNKCYPLGSQATPRIYEAVRSNHASRRIKDRSIPRFIIDAILDFGERRPSGDGTESCYFSRRGWRRYAAYLGHESGRFRRYRNIYLVVAPDGVVITACWRH